jgi:hypothetical protein
VLIEAAKEARGKMETQAKMVTAYANAADMLSDAASKLFAANLLEDAAILAAAAVDLGGIVESDIRRKQCKFWRKRSSSGGRTTP